MQYNKQYIKAFIQQFYHLYYAKKEDDILNMLTPDFVLSGVLVDHEVEGKRFIKKWIDVMVSKDVVFNRSDLHIEVEAKEDTWLVETTYTLGKSDCTQVSLACSFMVINNNGPKIKKAFVSFVEQGCDNQDRVDFLESFVLEKDDGVHQQELSKDVPGGIIKCLYNEELTLLEMNEGFLHICGYTREELKTNFNNSLRALIVEEDFQKAIVEVKEQLKVGPTKRIEYRIRQKNGNELWLLDKGRLIDSAEFGQCFHCLLIDISGEKELNEAYREMVERNQIIMSQTDDVIFEWDLIQDKVKVSQNLENKLMKKEWKKEMPIQKILENRTFFPIFDEDVKTIQNMVNDIKAGMPYVEVEVRIHCENETLEWRRIRISTKKDRNGLPLKAIGIIIDIDQEKKETLSLLEKAFQDSLTGMNNKGKTQELIREELSHNEEILGALLLIDIDDFKSVNDSMGHLYGDAVLKDVASVLQANTRSTDIIGRIGGDEFMLYLKDVKSIGNAKVIAQKIVNHIHELDALKNLSSKISCSIGISLYPTHCEDFNTLFKYCDYALYQAKVEGKNRFEVYNEKNIQEYLRFRVNSVASLINADIDTVHIKSGMSDIAQYVFEVLYHSEDIQEAIEKIMEIIGDKYDVSRVYIFENNESNEYCINTFEWCNHGINPQKHLLQNVSYEDLGGNYIDNFDERSIFYCSDINTLSKAQYDILAPQGIKSLLQCAIRDNGEFRGFIGFDECNENCYWTQDQVDLLILISEILSIFLLKRRKEEKYKEENNVLLSILDHQNSYIYIIDAHSYELLYMNNRTKQTDANAQLGQCCYQTFIGGDTPCQNCPAKLVGKHNTNATVEFHNERLGLWTDADASYIKWKGKDAILLVCHDIGRFKK